MFHVRALGKGRAWAGERCPSECTPGRSATDANANANSDAPREFASSFWTPNLKQKVANQELRRISLANANGFAHEISSSLRNFLANGSLP